MKILLNNNDVNICARYMFDVWNLMLKTLDEMSTFSKDIYNDETGTNRNSKFERLITI